jgi:hypothetical protein
MAFVSAHLNLKEPGPRRNPITYVNQHSAGRVSSQCNTSAGIPVELHSRNGREELLSNGFFIRFFTRQQGIVAVWLAEQTGFIPPAPPYFVYGVRHVFPNRSLVMLPFTGAIIFEIGSRLIVRTRAKQEIFASGNFCRTCGYIPRKVAPRVTKSSTKV